MATTLYDASGQEITVGGGTYESNLTITVGSGGDYETLNAAFEAITEKYPIYKKGGLAINIQILSGTTINEQIAVQKADFSYVTITAQDEYVPVNVDGFGAQGLDTHDLRTPNVGAFIGGENGAGLPCIGCVFKVTQNTNSIAVVGYFANRSSKGVVLANSGFDGFYDGCISNNESSITIRQGIAKNMTRWGVHARHNGEVSARSATLTNCTIGGYADRVANLDIREANCSNCACAAAAYHGSQICAAGTHCTNGGSGSGAGTVVSSQSGSMIDCNGMEIIDPDCHEIFGVSYGGMMTVCALSNFSNRNKCSRYSLSINTFGNFHGWIMADSAYNSHTLTVSATPSGATITVKKSSTATTTIDPDTGETDKWTLLDGTYYVTVSADGYVTNSQSVTISADQTLEVELESEL